MNTAVGLYDLWLFYVLAYAIALPVQNWVLAHREQP